MFCVLVTAVRLALMRNTVPAQDLVRGLVTLILTAGVSVPLVNYMEEFCDGFSTWIINRAGDTGTRLGSIGAGLLTLEAPLALTFAFIAVLASFAQVALMVCRVPIIAILTGVLPMFAAMSMTRTGDQSFRRVCGWLLAAVLYSPTAAVIYAGALWLVNTGQDAISVISGLAAIILAILALPALLRLVQPLTSPAVHAGGGGAMAGAGVMLATGARMYASQGGSSSASSSGTGNGGPTGAVNAGGSGANKSRGPSGAAGSNGHAGPAGSTGANAVFGAAGSTGANGVFGASGAAGAAGGPAVMVATEAAGAVKRGAQNSVPDGSDGPVSSNGGGK